MLKYTFIFLLAFLTSCSSSDTTSSNYIEAEVINIMSSLTIEDKDMKVESQSARIVVKLKSGEEKDKEVVINQQIVPKINDVAIPDVGDEIVLSETILSDGNTGLQIVDVKRSGVSIFSVILLFIVMAAIGGVKGLVFSLLLFVIFFSINYILFPVISWGLSPIFVTFIGVNLLNALIVFLVHSKEKVKPAIVSNFISLFVVSILAYLFSASGAFGSLLSRDNVSLINQDINVGSLIASAILVASAGVIINMNLSILANKEPKSLLAKSQEKNNFKTMLNSVRPAMFINILFVALIYMGLSLPIFFSKSSASSLRSIINTDTVTFYMIALSVSGIGIICSAAISCFVSLYLSSSDTSKKMRNVKATQGLKK